MTKKIKKILFLIGGLNIFFVFLVPLSAGAETCSWVASTTSYASGYNNPTYSNDCVDGTISADEKCSGTKPAGSASQIRISVNVCCCSQTIAEKNTINSKALEKEEKTSLFTIPDFQVEIPGLNKLATITCTTGEECEIPWIGQYISGIYNYALAIVGIVAAIVLMAGGLLWLISGGDASKITRAKELIIGSISGLIILVASYSLLLIVNPDLVNLKSISITPLNRMDIKFAENRIGETAEAYKAKPCATDDELKNGIDFYATGYFKYPYQENQSTRYLCMISMQGTCPNGLKANGTCKVNGEPIFPNYPDYPACKEFTAAQYNANYFSTLNNNLIVGETIAGPACSNLPKNTKVCFNGKTYTITDSGGGIKGRRIDILSASEEEANANSGVGKLTIGACK